MIERYGGIAVTAGALPAALAAALAVLSIGTAPARADTTGSDNYIVTLDEGVSADPVAGRLILFFILEPDAPWAGPRPIDAPFFSRPQPIASMDVGGLKPGGSVRLDDAALASVPSNLDSIRGSVRVQALLDCDRTERSHAAGPGNLYSLPVTVELAPGRADEVHLRLTKRIEPPPPRVDGENLKWVRLRSEMLSRSYGHDVEHRAGVALPKGYLDPGRGDERWPVLFVIPGYGGRDDGVVSWAQLHRQPGSEEVAPQAVVVVLDPESPLGHHGFVDSPNHGPRGTALVKELIPHLEARFRLDARPEARVVTGHSSGGWTSLWLALRWPDVFGACWSSSPDPIDFRAFQATDLYREGSLYELPDGRATPSYREPRGRDGERVMMTVRQEALMERAIHPWGASGQQWDAWEAMFSPRDPSTGLPKPMFDAVTGRIDHEVVEEHWSRFDIGRLLRERWDRYGPVMTGRVRLVCGTLDSFYLNRAVALVKQTVDELAPGHAGDGYILLVEGATHGNVRDHTFARWNDEMRAYLKKQGYRQE